MNIKKVLSTTLLVLWMITIFYFSNQQGTGSSSTSKKMTTIIINIFDIKKNITEDKKEEIVRLIEPYIRKIAHYTIYIVGGILIANCINAFIDKEKTVIISSAIIGILYAASDEAHQLLVNDRSGKITDVIIDSIGIFTGIAIYLLVNQIVFRLKKVKGGE